MLIPTHNMMHILVHLLRPICGTEVHVIRSIHPGDHLLPTTARSGHCSNFCFSVKVVNDGTTHHWRKAFWASNLSHLFIGALGRGARLWYYYACKYKYIL